MKAQRRRRGPLPATEERITRLHLRRDDGDFA